jgi:hypothetical protein
MWRWLASIFVSAAPTSSLNPEYTWHDTPRSNSTLTLKDHVDALLNIPAQRTIT